MGEKSVKKSIWKIVIIAPGGDPLTVEITSLGENEGLLRLDEWSNGILRLRVGDFDAKISTKMDLENGHILTRGDP